MSAEILPFPKDLPKEALGRMSPGELAKYMTTAYDCLSRAGQLQAQDIFRDNGMPGIADALRDYGAESVAPLHLAAFMK